MSAMPDLASMLGGSAAGAGPGVPSGPPPPDSDGDAGPEAKMRKALTLLQEAAADPSLDDVDSHVATKCIAAIQGVLATNQKNDEAALGVTPAHKSLARNTRAQAAY